MIKWLRKLFGKQEKSSGFEKMTIRHDSDETFEQNQDLIEGYVFNATLQIRTPLEVLNRHGEVFRGPPSKAPNYAGPADGIWIFKLKWQDDGYEHTHASDIGYTTPREYLPFLKSFRTIVEAPDDIDIKLSKLDRLSKESIRNQEIWAKLDKYYGDFPHSFFYNHLTVLPGVGKKTAKLFYESGLRELSDIEKASDTQLQSLQGVGKGLVSKVRTYFAEKN